MTGRRSSITERALKAARLAGLTTTLTATLGVAAMATACSSTKRISRDAAAPQTYGANAALRPRAEPVAAPPPPRAPLDAPLLATLGERSVGPFVARRGTAGLAAYLATASGGARSLFVAPLGPDGEGKADPQAVVPAPLEPTSLVLRPTGGPRPGFLAAWTTLAPRGMGLSVAALGDDGTLRGPALEVTRTSENIVWSEVVPSAKGALCFWAEETRQGDAQVFVVALDDTGRTLGVPSRVGKGARAWQVREMVGGAAVALVLVGQGADDRDGPLTWQRLDSLGRPTAAPVVVRGSGEKGGAGVGADLDMVRAGSGFAFAWTDRRGEEPEVHLSYLEDGGRVTPAIAPFADAGGSVLTGVVAGPTGLLVAWEEPHRHDRNLRPLHLALLGDDGRLESRAQVTLQGRGKGGPELASVAGQAPGFALMGEIAACGAPDADIPRAGPCTAALADPALGPTFVRLDRRLRPLQVEPLGAATGGPRSVALAWQLACDAEACRALLASPATPTEVRGVVLARRDGPFRVALQEGPGGEEGAPRVTSVSTLTAGRSMAHLTTLPLADSTLVATLTVDESRAEGLRSDRRAKAGKATDRGDVGSSGATLALRVLDEGGHAVGEPVLLSTRAVATGGVALAPAGSGRDAAEGGALAWVARDNGTPQVHVTRIDRKGRRTNDVQLTLTTGDVTDVALAWVKDGWVVAWIDGRNGNGEVYATKVSTELRRVSREERITRAPGDASGLAILAQGTKAWLAWADPREAPTEGMADIYVAAVAAHDAKRIGEDTRLLATVAHSRSPVLVPTSDGVAVGWIEEAPAGVHAAATSAYGAMVAWLDGQGAMAHGPRRLAPPAGAPTAIALQNARGSLRGVLARSTVDGVSLDAVPHLSPSTEGAPVLSPLFGLEGPPSLDVSLALDGNAVLFNDDGPRPEARRVRRLAVQWGR